MSKIKKAVATFGRQMFDLYDRHPLLCNTVAGSAVYSAGELIVQDQRRRRAEKAAPPVSAPPAVSAPPPVSSLDYKRICQIGILGGVENGVFMLLWYNALNNFLGSSKTTVTVLIKCFFDQVFFAAQSDASFLALCAIQGKKSLEDATREVKRTFLTTWINDCSVWPLVNFVGFSAVPVKIQPTFMSIVQLGWQVYLSGVASAGSDGNNSASTSSEDQRLAASFRVIDLDGNGFIDAMELQTALALRGLTASSAEVKKMMAEANKKYGRAEDTDSQVSLEAFKAIVKKGGGLKYAHMWQRLQNEFQLEKGLKKSLQRLEVQKKQQLKPSSSSMSSQPADGALLVASNDEEAGLGDVSFETLKSAWATIVSVLTENDDGSYAYGEQWKESRDHAVQNSVIGGGALVFVAIVRRFIFKI